MKNVWWSRLLLALITLTLISSCKQQARKVSKQLKESEINFDYFSTKAKVKYSNDVDGVSANLSLRMQDKKVIWASITKFSREAVRIKLEPDSAHFLNKYPAEDRYYSIFPTEEYLSKSGFNLDFKGIQNLLFGIHPIEIEDKDRVVVKDSIINILQVRANVRIETKLDLGTSRIISMKTIANDGKDTINTSFNNYELVDNHYIPTKLKIEASVEKEGERMIANSEITYSKPKFTSDPVSFSFKVPKGYEKR